MRRRRRTGGVVLASEARIGVAAAAAPAGREPRVLQFARGGDDLHRTVFLQNLLERLAPTRGGRDGAEVGVRGRGAARVTSPPRPRLSSSCAGWATRSFLLRLRPARTTRGPRRSARRAPPRVERGGNEDPLRRQRRHHGECRARREGVGCPHASEDKTFLRLADKSVDATAAGSSRNSPGRSLAGALFEPSRKAPRSLHRNSARPRDRSRSVARSGFIGGPRDEESTS